MDNNLNNQNENNNDEQKYTFVRETIKEKPPLAVRVILKIAKVLGLGIVFGLGICIVLFIFGRDIRDIFGDKGDDGNDKSTVTEESAETTVYEKATEQQTISLEESIDSKIVDVIVVCYEEEKTKAEDLESSTTQNMTTAVYEEEDGTASISDNKEVQTTTSQNETTVQETESSTEVESTSILDESNTDRKKIKEKKHYTGVVVLKQSEVIICIAYDKIKNGDEIYVSFADGKQIKATISGQENINGIALLKVDAAKIDNAVLSKVTVADVVEMKNHRKGDEIVYAGNPYGSERLFYSGTLAGIDDGHSNYDTFYRGIITDISNGDVQDGFLFDIDGKLVAMVSKIGDSKTVARNVSGVCMEDMIHVVQSLLYKTTINHIGVKGETVTDDMRDLTQENMPDGMYVVDVAKNSTAYKSGIMVGDIITKADGNEVKSIKDIQTALKGMKAENSITIVLKRKIGTNYNEFTIKVPVEAY